MIRCFYDFNKNRKLHDEFVIPIVFPFYYPVGNGEKIVCQ